MNSPSVSVAETLKVLKKLRFAVLITRLWSRTMNGSLKVARIASAYLTVSCSNCSCCRRSVNIPKDERNSDDFPVGVMNWGSSKANGFLCSVFRYKQGVLCQTDDLTFTQRTGGRVFDRLPSFFINDFENFFERDSHGIGLCPPR